MTDANGVPVVRIKWIAVDFDETLRRWDGTPIQPMVNRVKKWLAEGRAVRIVTARLAQEQHDEIKDWPKDLHVDDWLEKNGGRGVENQTRFVQDWCELHIGVRLPVQAHKGPGMIELWDDKVVRVEENTGRRLSPSKIETDLTDTVERAITIAVDAALGEVARQAGSGSHLVEARSIGISHGVNLLRSLTRLDE